MHRAAAQKIGVHKKCIFYTQSCMKIECAKLIKTFFNNNYFISLSSITTMFLALVCLFFVPTLSVFFLSPLKFLLKEQTHHYFPLPLCDYFLWSWQWDLDRALFDVIFPGYLNFPIRSRCVLKAIINKKNCELFYSSVTWENYFFANRSFLWYCTCMWYLINFSIL